MTSRSKTLPLASSANTPPRTLIVVPGRAGTTALRIVRGGAASVPAASPPPAVATCGTAVAAAPGSGAVPGRGERGSRGESRRRRAGSPVVFGTGRSRGRDPGSDSRHLWVMSDGW
ncbi:hypothetical protein [Umezawaea sp.]|uniref:hypothetical protein n=1 Tax=Umezawaea sp. TaxID=1955258 RepID=UPI002ED24D74